MDMEQISDKHLHDMERISRELIDVLRRAKLQDTPLMEMLLDLERDAGKLRRERFDADNTEYMGF